MAVTSHGAKLILSFCKFENTSENPTAFEARENPIAYSSLETLLVIQQC